jgi:DNA-3-methyladenine glycosylase
MKPHLLPLSFYNRPTLIVAREMLGMRLVRMIDGERISGIISEAEAYIGETDLGCHAKAGKTNRTKIMYGRAGIAYVYFTYGQHWMLNAVTEAKGFPAAVLIRAIEPEEGLGMIKINRAKAQIKDWTNGPAKITSALMINSDQNGIDLTTRKAGLWIEEAEPISDSRVTNSPRVGLYTVPEPWKSIPWRFNIGG